MAKAMTAVEPKSLGVNLVVRMTSDGGNKNTPSVAQPSCDVATVGT
ncbi:MAG: hypothetical protein JWP58_4603 [Hymenobacter sp.]|nr:hypothetical protein [Hymenobacter sp.]